MTRIRRIEPGDREAIRELIAGTNAFKPFEVNVAMELVDVALTQKEQDDYHPYVLVEDDGTVVAYACFGKNAMTTGTFDLYWIATRTDRMGKGYGRVLLSFVEEARGVPPGDRDVVAGELRLHAAILRQGRLHPRRAVARLLCEGGRQAHLPEAGALKDGHKPQNRDVPRTPPEAGQTFPTYRCDVCP
ncbi:MAG: putative acetyltransferase [Deltaproteobacteria bacterium]|nr:putative acetyltransferase [Deltaproteobacteria bacterium]